MKSSFVLVAFGHAFIPFSSHPDAGASDSPRRRVLRAQSSLWGPEPAARRARHREHPAGERQRPAGTKQILFVLRGNAGNNQLEFITDITGNKMSCAERNTTEAARVILSYQFLKRVSVLPVSE